MNLKNRLDFFFGVGGGMVFEPNDAGGVVAGAVAGAVGGGGGVKGTLLAGIDVLDAGTAGIGSPGDTFPTGRGSSEALLWVPGRTCASES